MGSCISNYHTITTMMASISVCYDKKFSSILSFKKPTLVSLICSCIMMYNECKVMTKVHISVTCGQFVAFS